MSSDWENIIKLNMTLTFTPANESDSFNKKKKKKGNNGLLVVD